MEIYETKPKNFDSALQVASCYLQVEGHLLLLRRASHKSDPGFWGPPAGKVEVGETVIQAAVRELCEETGISIEGSQLRPFGSLYVRREGEFVFHMFATQLEHFPSLTLSSEHDEARWVHLKQVEELALIPGGFEAFRNYLRIFLA